MTVSEYARKVGLTDAAILYQIRRGQVQARKINCGPGRSWRYEVIAKIGTPKSSDATTNGFARDGWIVLTSRKFQTLDVKTVIEMADWLAKLAGQVA